MDMHTGKHKFVCMLNAQASWFLLGGPPHHHSQPIHKVWSSQPTMELAEGTQMTECARVKTCPPPPRPAHGICTPEKRRSPRFRKRGSIINSVSEPDFPAPGTHFLETHPCSQTKEKKLAPLQVDVEGEPGQRLLFLADDYCPLNCRVASSGAEDLAGSSRVGGEGSLELWALCPH